MEEEVIHVMEEEVIHITEEMIRANDSRVMNAVCKLINKTVRPNDIIWHVLEIMDSEIVHHSFLRAAISEYTAENFQRRIELMDIHYREWDMVLDGVSFYKMIQKRWKTAPSMRLVINSIINDFPTFINNMPDVVSINFKMIHDVAFAYEFDHHIHPNDFVFLKLAFQGGAGNE